MGHRVPEDMKQFGGAEAALPNLECLHETECEYKLCKINYYTQITFLSE